MKRKMAEEINMEIEDAEQKGCSLQRSHKRRSLFAPAIGILYLEKTSIEAGAGALYTNNDTISFV